jgi:hypothetical protein
MKFHFSDYAMGIWIVLFIQHYEPDAFDWVDGTLIWTVPFAVLGAWAWIAYRSPR